MNRIILTPLPNAGMSIRTIESESDELVMTDVQHGYYDGVLEVDGVIRNTFKIVVDSDLKMNLNITTEPVVEWRQITSYETIPFTTRRENDNTLASGTEVVRTEGVNGRMKVITEHEYVNNVRTGQERELGRTTEVAMVPKVIRVGTKATGRRTHKVVEGDTLWSISQKYGVTLDQLRTWNGLTSDTLNWGQVLFVEAPIT